MLPPKPIKVKLKSGGSTNGSNNFENKVAAMIALQTRSKAGQQATPGEINTGRTDPFSGIKTETLEGNQLAARQTVMKKAGEDALKLGQSYKFIEELENDYTSAYKGKDIGSGLPGGVGATKEYLTGVIGRQNDPLRRYARNRAASGVAIGRFSGDVGNFAWQEQLAHLNRLPEAGPNARLQNLFMADDPSFGASLFEDIKSIYAKKMAEAQEVARTGIVPESSEYAKFLQGPTSPIPGMNDQMAKGNNLNLEQERQEAIKKIQSGKYDAKKVADIFRSRTGQELNG